jgi:dTDP-4-dehydrorhamnose reductase
VNGAGFTQVDRCEREPELARRANAHAPAVLARACAEAGARFVHVSTDYVFSGDAKRPYREDDPTGPRCVYGAPSSRRSRGARGLARVPRRAHELGVRQGPQLHRRGAGAGRRAARRQRVRAAARGRRSARRPTYAVDLAAAIVQLVARARAAW